MDIAVDVAAYTGLKQFGEAYRIMLENDAHAPGSVDRVLMAGMVRLCAATATYLYTSHTPTCVGYVAGTRPELERVVRLVTAGSRSDEERVAAIAAYCAALAEEAGSENGGPDGLVLGGREEEIIRRGSDWCTDLARVGCALCQVSGLPSRIVYLADTARAYSGHAIIEVYRDGSWGAVDVTRGVVYRWPEGRPATTWELVANPWLIARHASGSASRSGAEGQFRRAAIANYGLGEASEYDYTVSRPNAYYRRILAMSEAGWPGGLRWLYGEDRVAGDEVVAARPWSASAGEEG